MRKRPAWRDSRSARLVRRASLVIAGAALAWLMVLIIAGGFDTTILGLRIRSNNPYRVATLLTAALVAFVLAGGSVRGLARSAFGVLRRWTVAAVSRHGW